ncbi:MAG: MFS transporter [Chloroflexus sp.]|uniref:MFS transporter n=1 Tax=Chloroflexus sp. TaxID=1904827 RepID=UPI004049EC4B
MNEGRKWWALAAVGTGVLVSTIDGSIVNIALNTLVQAFASNLNVVEWVVLGYLLTLVCTLLIMGRLGDMYGKRRIYLIGFALFTIASLLCATAPSIVALIGFRVLQGIGAAMIQAVGPALLVTAFPARERGMALGAIGSFVAAGILIGPALGGVLLQYIGWEAIFFVNLPIGVLGWWLTIRSISPDHTTRPGQRFDLIGAVLMAVTLFCLLLGLTEGPLWGWSDSRVIGLFATSLIGGILFVWWEWRHPQPMLQLRMFRRLAFSLNLLAALILFLGISFNLLLTPLFFQLVYQFDLQRTGLMLMALPIALSLTSPIGGRLSDRFGPRVLTIVGLLVTGCALLGLSTTTPVTPPLQMLSFLILLGIGVGLFQSPNNSTVLGDAPPEALGVASGLLAVVRTIGQTGGIALAGAIWASQIFALNGGPVTPLTAAPPPILASGYDVAMRVAALLAAITIVPSLIGGYALQRQIAPARPPVAD